jgi:hypothetical protein
MTTGITGQKTCILRTDEKYDAWTTSLSSPHLYKTKSIVVAHSKQYSTYYHTMMQTRLFSVHDWGNGKHLGR